MLQFILNKPIWMLSGICLLLFISADIFFNAVISASAAHYILLSGILILCCTDFIKRITMAIIALVFALIYVFSAEQDIFLLLGEIINICILAKHNKFTKEIIIFSIIALGFILHLYYIQNTAIDVRQHDLSGILFYMKSITQNGINFIHFNPWQMYYLFHQPLHFIIYGHIYFLELKLLGSTIAAQEGLQYISLYYVTISTLVAIKIFDTFNFNKYIFYGATILFAFNPTLFLFSGYISDDVLVFMLSLLFLYYLINWYKTDKTNYIIYAAICFGFGVLTKLSILILSPAVALLFLIKLWHSEHKNKVIEAISYFTIIAVPLSLIWIARNHILFDMAFYNIPDTSPSGQNFKYLTFIERITDFSTLLSPFIKVPELVENNMWLALVKTELFGEWDMSISHPFAGKIAYLLYFINIILSIVALISSFVLSFRYFFKKADFLAFFFALIYIITWLYSFKYAMDYPYACSTDYRLFATLMLPELIIISLAIPKKSAPYLFGSALGYALFSSLIYIFGI